MSSNSTFLGSDSSTERISLQVAIIAVIVSSLISILQLAIAYTTAAIDRSKTNSAAIGDWSRFTRYGFREIWKGRIQVKYGVMELSVDKLEASFSWNEIVEMTCLKVLADSGHTYSERQNRQFTFFVH